MVVGEADIVGEVVESCALRNDELWCSVVQESPTFIYKLQLRTWSEWIGLRSCFQVTSYEAPSADNGFGLGTSKVDHVGVSNCCNSNYC